MLKVAPAKINLRLRVFDKLITGRHQLASIIAPLALADEVSVEITNNAEISVSTELTGECKRHVNAAMDIDKSLIKTVKSLSSIENIAGKVAKEFFKEFRLSHGGNICIKKNIPFQAGLGGGSANAGAVLRALCEYFNISEPSDAFSKVRSLASKLGSDIAVQFYNKPAFVCGTGEVVIGLQQIGSEFNGFSLLLIKPPFGISTAEAYRFLGRRMQNSLTLRNDDVIGCSEDIIREVKGELEKALSMGFSFDENDPNILLTLSKIACSSGWPSVVAGAGRSLTELFINDFEEMIPVHYPRLAVIFDKLLEVGAMKALLCGSGSTVAGFFSNEEVCKSAEHNLRGQLSSDYFICSSSLLF